MIKKPLIIHPLFIATYPILFVFAHNINSLQFSELSIPLTAVYILTFIFFWTSNLMFKNKYKTALLTSTLILIILGYGHVFDALRSTQLNGLIRGKHTYTFTAIFIVVLFISYVILKIQTRFYKITSIVNLISIVLIITTLFPIVNYYSSITRFDLPENGSHQLRVNGENPDIYYFIFDRYARGDILKNVFSYDNSEFLSQLEKRGFYIASRSWANYTSSDLSIASSLNMQYINDLVNQVGENSSNVKPLYEMIEKNKIWQNLKSQGYMFIQAGSFWTGTAVNKYADRNINITLFSEFSEILFNKSIFYPVTIKLGIKIFDTRYTQWRRETYKFDELAKIPNINIPTFVFSHFLLPHEPYVFDKYGNYISEEQAVLRVERDKYIDQLIFANNKILRLIDEIIIKTKDVQPIIIIQADEGPYPESYKQNSLTYDWSRAIEADIDEKMSILNAYY